MMEDQDDSKTSLLSWGLPRSVYMAYVLKGVKNLYEWQVECLKLPLVLAGKNLVYSAPTSGGKTLVSELLCLKGILEQRKKAIFVVPYKSMVREKARYFQELLHEEGLKVGGFTGKHSPNGGFESVDMAVCVIEKANSLINRLIMEERLDELAIIVVDEVHQIGDHNRGYLLEDILTKVMYMRMKISKLNIQIVGMSATLPNIKDLAHWLDAAYYTTDFRPVPLYQYCMLNGKMYNSKSKLVDTIKPSELFENDQSCISQMCYASMLSDESSVLVFCMSKAHVESLAAKIARDIKNANVKADNKMVTKPEINEILAKLKASPVGLNEQISQIVSGGVGIHHAGLSEEERDIMEEGFRNCVLRVLVSTSTLCSGVNLPARQVVVRYGPQLSPLMYQQMAGRAGRTGYDSIGKSFLVVNNDRELKVAVQLMNQHVTSVNSCMFLENGLSTALKQAVIEMVASGAASCKEELVKFIKSTLLISGNVSAEGTINVDELVNNCIRFLMTKEFIRKSTGEDKEKLVPTRLGRACLIASMRPDAALELYQELERSLSNFMLSCDLHLIYMAVPQEGGAHPEQIDWITWLNQFLYLPKEHKEVATIVGVQEKFIGAFIASRVNRMAQSTLLNIARHSRFRKALALHELVRERPLDLVAKKMGFSRGQLQAIQQSAAMQAGRVTVFCRELGWSNMAVLMENFKPRLNFGVQIELVELLRISLVDSQHARALYNKNYHSLADLAKAHEEDIELILLDVAPYQASHKRENESEFAQRKRVRCREMHEYKLRKQARGIIAEARQIVQDDIGGGEIDWEKSKQQKLSQRERGKFKIRPTSCKGDYQVDCVANMEKHAAHIEGKMEENGAHIAGKIKEHVAYKEGKMQEHVAHTKGNMQEHVALMEGKVEEHVAHAEGKMKEHTAYIEEKMEEKMKEHTTHIEEKMEEHVVNTEGKMVEHMAHTEGKMEEGGEEMELVENADAVENNLHAAVLDKQCITEHIYTPSALLVDSMQQFLSGCSPDIFDTISPLEKQNLCKVTTSKICDSLKENISPNVIESSPEVLDSSLMCDSALYNVLCQYDTKSPFEVKRQQSCHVSTGSKHAEPLEDPSYDSLFEFAFSSSILDHITPSEAECKGAQVDANLNAQVDANLITKADPNLSVDGTCKSDDVNEDSGDLEQFEIVMLDEKEVFRSFSKEWKTKGRKFSLAVACERCEVKIIGANVVGEAAAAQISSQQNYDFASEYTNMKLAGAAICWGGLVAYYLDLHNTPGCEVSMRERINLLQSMLHSNKATFKCYNAKEQLRLLKIWTDISVKGATLFGDPFIAGWLIQPEKKHETLNYLVIQHCPELLHLVEHAGSMRGNNSLGMGSLTSTPAILRAAIEACITHYITIKLHQKLKQLDLWNIYTEVELPLVRCLVEAEVGGINMDMEEAHTIIEQLKQLKEDIIKQAHQCSNSKFCLDSRPELTQVLYNNLGLTTTLANGKKTKTYKTDKVTLLEMAQQHPLPKLIVEYRSVCYILSQILVPLFREIEKSQHAEDNSELSLKTVQPSYLIRSATGRLYMCDPNLQNIPRDLHIQGKEIKPRNQFKASPGNIFISADYKQIELRMLAHFSQDSALIEILESGKDIFREIAAKALNKSCDDVTDELRQQAKVACYSFIYGKVKEDNVFDENVDSLNLSHISQQLSKYFSIAFHFLELVKNECCVPNAAVNSLKGRKRWLNTKNSNKKGVVEQSQRQAVNTLMQGSAADVVKCAMIQLQNALERENLQSCTKLVLHIHDELILETKKENKNKIVNILKNAMECGHNLNVSLPVKVKVGLTWSDLKEV